MEILTMHKKHSREAKPARFKKKKWQMRHYRKNYVKTMQKIHFCVEPHCQVRYTMTGSFIVHSCEVHKIFILIYFWHIQQKLDAGLSLNMKAIC